MKVYLDNVIVCGRIRSDIEPTEMAAVRKLEQQPYCEHVKILTSRESWREQEQTCDPGLREKFRQSRDDVPVVQNDYRLLGFFHLQDQYGGFIANPIKTHIVDAPLLAYLKTEGLKDNDALHLMYAVFNGCQRFVTVDPHFLDRRKPLEVRCQGLSIVKPSELIAELSKSLSP